VWTKLGVKGEERGENETEICIILKRISLLRLKQHLGKRVISESVLFEQAMH
jgi:hypothetical protein